MLNKIIRDYGYHKNLDAHHPDYIAAWEIAEYVPWLIESNVRVLEASVELANQMQAENKKLQVELDATHAALRGLLDVVPEHFRHEIGIAENPLNNPISNPLMPELCQPITKRPLRVAEWEPVCEASKRKEE